MHGELIPGVAVFAGGVLLGETVDVPSLSEGGVDALVVPSLCAASKRSVRLGSFELQLAFAVWMLIARPTAPSLLSLSYSLGWLVGSRLRASARA